MPPTFKLELTGPQFRPLSEALRATLDLNGFDQMLKQRLDINRQDITVAHNYQTIVFEVISAANRESWVYLLVDAVRQERPKNPVFVEYERMLSMGPQGLPDQTRLESIINESNALLDVDKFLGRLGEVVGQVCRVDLRGDGNGTGFLIGPRAVLTNYHVIESVIKQAHSLQDFTCRFDYKVRADGTSVNKGTVYNVTDLVAHSPYDPADLVRDTQQPDPNKLDYALLLLEGEPGNDPLGGKPTGDPRGWVKMPAVAHAFSANSPLFIVQHPDKKPMKLALDTDAVIGLNNNRTRVEYKTNTEPGSSGSPCFDQNWELVALHHSGDPSWAPTWNEGIPIQLITAHLQASEQAKQYLG